MVPAGTWYKSSHTVQCRRAGLHEGKKREQKRRGQHGKKRSTHTNTHTNTNVNENKHKHQEKHKRIEGDLEAMNFMNRMHLPQRDSSLPDSMTVEKVDSKSSSKRLKLSTKYWNLEEKFSREWATTISKEARPSAICEILLSMLPRTMGITKSGSICLHRGKHEAKKTEEKRRRPTR